MRLKHADKDAATIATDLGVRYVLRRSGDALRVTARLVDAHKDVQLWSERYTGVANDIFSIQEQVARGIVDALSVELTPQEDQALGVRDVTDPARLRSVPTGPVGVLGVNRRILDHGGATSRKWPCARG